MNLITPLFVIEPQDNLHAEIDRRVRECGITLETSTLRDPNWTSAEIPKLKQWHQDGSTIAYIVLWASAQPTEFRLQESHACIPVAPGAAVLVDNRQIEHRMPANTHDRWFYQAVVKSLSDFDLGRTQPCQT